MKKTVLLTVALYAVTVCVSVFATEWEICQQCHNGEKAPSQSELLSRFQTAAFFVRAAQTKDNPDMKPLQAPEKETILYSVAEELGMEVKWNHCKTCHQQDNEPAPSRETVKQKFKTAPEFVRAAKNAKSPLMSPIKLSKNDETLYRVALELGLR